MAGQGAQQDHLPDGAAGLQPHAEPAVDFYNDLFSDPDTTNSRQRVSPGFTHDSSQDSERYTFQTSLRSTFGKSIVNELRFGRTGGATLFSKEVNAAWWGSSALPNQGGYRLSISGADISNPDSGSGNSAREASTWVFEDSLTWSKGKHSPEVSFP
ncbi:MAG: hypothetical protein ACE148_16700 [Vicinamibacterales bacterium]